MAYGMRGVRDIIWGPFGTLFRIRFGGFLRGFPHLGVIARRIEKFIHDIHIQNQLCRN